MHFAQSWSKLKSSNIWTNEGQAMLRFAQSGNVSPQANHNVITRWRTAELIIITGLSVISKCSVTRIPIMVICKYTFTVWRSSLCLLWLNLQGIVVTRRVYGTNIYVNTWAEWSVNRRDACLWYSFLCGLNYLALTGCRRGAEGDLLQPTESDRLSTSLKAHKRI